MFYVITKGRKSKIVENWEECVKIIKENNGANYNEFNNYSDAKKYYDSYNLIKNGGISYEFKEIIQNSSIFNNYSYKPLNKEITNKIIFVDYRIDETREEGNIRIIKELKKKELEKEKLELKKKKSEINKKLKELEEVSNNEDFE